jgi:FHA domain
MPRLIVTNGPLAGRRLEIDAELLVGGHSGSPGGAVVRNIAGALQVEDLGSGPGTWVNGVRIAEPVMLSDGAELQVDTTTYIVEIDDDEVDRRRTNPALVALPALARPAVPAPAPYVPPPHAHRRRADSRRWLPAAATFATIIATAVALVIYFAIR